MNNLLVEILEELVVQKSAKIGWNYDGSEIDLIMASPEYQLAVSGNDLEDQLLDLIAVVNKWADNTKNRCM